MTNSSRHAILISQSPGLKWQFSSAPTSHHQDSDYEVQKKKDSDYVLEVQWAARNRLIVQKNEGC
jgi:hypothetical protein